MLAGLTQVIIRPHCIENVPSLAEKMELTVQLTFEPNGWELEALLYVCRPNLQYVQNITRHIYIKVFLYGGVMCGWPLEQFLISEGFSELEKDL